MRPGVPSTPTDRHMFTGIVETTGTVTSVDRTPEGTRLAIETELATGIDPGASIAIDGVCLTAETVDPPEFTVFLAAETRDRTYLDTVRPGMSVNLERPVPVDGRLDGHIVQGHVDATATILDRTQLGEDWRYAFSLPPELTPYIVEKGSVAVDGISLTVASLDEERFEVAIIPETRARTTLGEKSVDDPVHLEVDVIARYVERLLDRRG